MQAIGDAAKVKRLDEREDWNGLRKRQRGKKGARLAAIFEVVAVGCYKQEGVARLRNQKYGER